MNILVALISSGKGTWNQVSQLIKANNWNHVYLVCNDFGYSNFNVDLNKGIPHLNQYQRGSSNLYHITGGLRSVLSRGSVLLGIEYTFGYNDEMPQFGNFHYPGVYDPNRFIALQESPKKEMNFAYNGIGIYFGLVFSFD